MKTKKQGFTLLEILLVVAIIAILAAIVIIAINPNKQLSDSRNSARWSDVNTILNAVYQYSIDTNGTVPSTISTSLMEICKTGGACSGYIDLSALTDDGTYLTAIPIDPLSSSANGTGYYIQKTANNRIRVLADFAENNETIEATK